MRALSLTLAVVVLSGCATFGPAASPSTENFRIRQMGKDILHATAAVLTITNNTSALINSLPLDVAVKDTYDCAVLKVIGASPSPIVTKVCGPIPTLEDAPLALAMTRLKAAASCATVRAIASEVIGAVAPLIAKLAASGQPSLGYAATSIQMSLTFIQQFMAGGATCSV